MIRTEKIIKSMGKELLSMLESSTLIYNKALYFLRQTYFKTRDEGKIKTPSYNELYNLVKVEDCYNNSILDSCVRQAVIKQVSDNWNAFIKATMSYNKNPKKFLVRPKIPSYLKEGKLNVITIDKSRLRKTNCKEREIRLPKSSYFICLPSYIDKSSIKCIKIVSFYNKAKILVCYEKKNEPTVLSYENCIGIDIGVNNLCSITSNNQPLSWIVNGRIVKSYNQYFNKQKALIQSELEKCNKRKTSKRLERLSKKRNLKMLDYFHNVSRYIIRLCLFHNIGAIIIGHNKGWKQEVSMGKRNNQTFVSIPFNVLIEKIKYKAEVYGIQVFVTEESYTSKIDHLALEPMEKRDIYLGKRICRGLFQSFCGKVLNADINGAIGILRKQKAIPDVLLENLRDRGDVVSPMKFPTRETHKPFSI